MWKRVVLLLCLVAGFCISLSHGFSVDDEVTQWPYDAGREQQDGDAATDVGRVIQEDVVQDNDSAVQQILSAFQIDYNNSQGTDQTATFFLNNLANWVLAIAGFVALVVLIVGFYKMFAASDNKEAYNEALKIVKGAAIAILVIGLSWFIVSRLFDIFFIVRDDI